MSLSIRRKSAALAALALLLFAANGGTFRVPALSSLIWLAAYGAVLLWVAQRPYQALRQIGAAWPLLALGALALASMIWSVNPARSLTAAVQLTMTLLIAVRLAAVFSPREIFTALFLAQSLGIAASLANAATGALPPAYEAHGPLIGIYVQKSWMGKAAFWWAFSAAALALWHRVPLLALPAILLGLGLAFAAKSFLAILAFGAIGLLALLALARRLPRRARLALPMGAAVLFLAGGLIWSATGGSLVAEGLGAAGKSTTLTGRTILWEIGMRAFGDAPLTGVGYGAFWHSAEYALDVRFVHANVDHGLLGFHNAYVEALVSLGAVGGSVFAWLIASTLWRLSVWLRRAESPDAAILLSSCFAILIIGFFDDYFFRQHAPHLILFAMAWIYATPYVRSANRRRRARFGPGNPRYQPRDLRPRET